LHAFGPSLRGYGYSPRFLPWLIRERENFDAVVVHGIWQYPGLATWLALRGTDTPYVVFAHGMLDPWFRKAYPIRHLKKSLYWFLAEHRVLRDARALLFTSEEERNAASGIFRPYDCREVVVGLGTGEPQGDSVYQKEIFLSKYPHLRRGPIILFLSRVHEKKGCDMLLKAFGQLVSKHATLQLVMAGPSDARYAERLRAQYISAEPELLNRVTWTGLISGDLKWGALYAADALILPSHQENFGVVVAEALACGTPVLVSNKVNIWSDIIASNAGLVEGDDFAGTERLLERWLSLSQAQKIEMRENAKKCFQEKFEIHIVYGRLMSLLETLVREPR